MSICLHNRIESICIFCKPPEPPPIRYVNEDVAPPTSEELFSESKPFEMDFLRSLLLGIVIGIAIGLLF